MEWDTDGPSVGLGTSDNVVGLVPRLHEAGNESFVHALF